MTRDEFWSSTQRTLNAYASAYQNKRKVKDEEHWMLGIYFKSAFETVLSNSFSKNPNAKYIEKPLLHDVTVNKDISAEERADMENYKTMMTLRIMQANFELSKL